MVRQRCSSTSYEANYDFTCTALQNLSLTSIVKRGKKGGGEVCGFRSMVCGPEMIVD